MVQSGHAHAAEWQTLSELLLTYDGEAVEQLTTTTVDANGRAGLFVLTRTAILRQLAL